MGKRQTEKKYSLEMKFLKTRNSFLNYLFDGWSFYGAYKRERDLNEALRNIKNTDQWFKRWGKNKCTVLLRVRKGKKILAYYKIKNEIFGKI